MRRPIIWWVAFCLVTSSWQWLLASLEEIQKTSWGRAGGRIFSALEIVWNPPSLPTSVGCTLSIRRSRIADASPEISITLRICGAKNPPTAQSFEIAGMQPRPLDQYLLPLVPIQHKPLPSGTKPVPNCIDIHRKQTRVLIRLRIDLHIDRRILFIHREKVPCKRWL